MEYILTVIEGPAPGSNGVDLGSPESPISYDDLSKSARMWLDECNFDTDHPDIWVLVTPTDEDPNVTNGDLSIRVTVPTLPVAILNTSIVTADGSYYLETITLDQAKEIVKDHDIDSAVRHGPTAALLTEVLGVPIPLNRQQFSHQVGQMALVFKLNSRIEEGKILSLEEMEEIGYSFKILFRRN